MRIQRRALETYYREKEKKDKKMKRKKETERLKRASIARKKIARQKKADVFIFATVLCFVYMCVVSKIVVC